jgi:hypothetical protein
MQNIVAKKRAHQEDADSDYLFDKVVFSSLAFSSSVEARSRLGTELERRNASPAILLKRNGISLSGISVKTSLKQRNS